MIHTKLVKKVHEFSLFLFDFEILIVYSYGQTEIRDTKLLKSNGNDCKINLLTTTIITYLFPHSIIFPD